MERGPLQDKRIRSLLAEKFVEVWLHTDGKVHGPKFRELQLGFLGNNALPYWVIVDPETLEVLRTREYTDVPEEFLDFLDGDRPGG